MDIDGVRAIIFDTHKLTFTQTATYTLTLPYCGQIKAKHAKDDNSS